MDSGAESDRADAGGAGCWPGWLSRSLLPDRAFARAYEALGDQRRAWLKAVIARHHALRPPAPALGEVRTASHGLFTATTRSAPAPFTLVVTQQGFDSPALALAALMPAFAALVPDVLLARLGKAAEVPAALLCACELAGQERVAALGPVLLERLLLHLAQAGRPGVVLHPDTPELRAVLSRRALRTALDAAPLRLVALRLPLAPAIHPECRAAMADGRMELLYGGLAFADAPGPGRDPADYAMRRDLLILPEALADKALQDGAARLVLTTACLGQWSWPELVPDTFMHIRRGFGAAR